MRTHAEFDQYQRAQEAGAVCLEALKTLLLLWGEENLAQLNRRIYGAYSCGPWLAVRLHNGTWKHGRTELETVKLEDVAALKVGSIVEGSDAEVEGDVMELVSFEQPEDLVERFDQQLEGVNRQARSIWYDLHPDEGCDED